MLVRLRLRNNLLPTFKKQPHYAVKGRKFLKSASLSILYMHAGLELPKQISLRPFFSLCTFDR